MSTAEQIRWKKWRGYWRLREYQMRLKDEFMIPLGKLAGERMRELYPIDKPDDPPQQS